MIDVIASCDAIDWLFVWCFEKWKLDGQMIDQYLIDQYHANPLLDTSIHDSEWHDGEVEPYWANEMSEVMLMNVEEM